MRTCISVAVLLCLSTLPARADGWTLPLTLCGSYVWDHDKSWSQGVEIRLLSADGQRLSGIAEWSGDEDVTTDVTLEVVKSDGERLTVTMIESNPRVVRNGKVLPPPADFTVDGTYEGVADAALERLRATWTGDGGTGRLTATRCAGGESVWTPPPLPLGPQRAPRQSSSIRGQRPAFTWSALGDAQLATAPGVTAGA